MVLVLVNYNNLVSNLIFLSNKQVIWPNYWTRTIQSERMIKTSYVK